MTPFPPFGGGEAAVRGGEAPKVQTTSVKNAENRGVVGEVVCVLGKALSDMVCCSHVAPEHAHRWARAATCRLARGRLWLRGRLSATREPSAFVRVQ